MDSHHLIVALFPQEQRQENASSDSKGWKDYLYFNYKVRRLLWTQQGPRALHGLGSLCGATSAMAYGAAREDQWTVHILYWFVCWISEWIFRCIYNGLIKTAFDLKNTTISRGRLCYFASTVVKMSMLTAVFQRYSIIFLLIIKCNYYHRCVGVWSLCSYSFLSLMHSWAIQPMVLFHTIYFFCLINEIFCLIHKQL